MKICVIGPATSTGRGAGFATWPRRHLLRHRWEKIARSSERGAIYEPGLDKLIAHNVEESRLAFTPTWPRP